jgi:hypothetical protein
VLAAEHLLGLARLHLFLNGVESGGELLVDRLPAAEPLREHTQVVGLLPQAVAQAEVLLEPAAPLQDLLSLGLVLPEIGLRGLLLELGEFLGGTCGLKDSSADRPPASSSPGIV